MHRSDPDLRPALPVRFTRPVRRTVLLGGALLLGFGGCDGGVSPTDPEGVDALEFSLAAVEIAGDSATVFLHNVGSRAVGPIEFVATPLRDADGLALPGRRIVVDPTELATLAPAEGRRLVLRVDGTGPLRAGEFAAAVVARIGESAHGSVDVRWRIEPGEAGTVAELRLGEVPGVLRQGDPVGLEVEAVRHDGTPFADPLPSWRTEPAGAATVVDGRLVGYTPGRVVLIGELGDGVDSVSFEVTARDVSGRFREVARGSVTDRFTSDLWVHGGAAWTGTWSARTGVDGTFFGNTLHAWDVSGELPLRTASLEVDARTVNDIKVRADGTLGVLTHEGSNDARNGFTLLDLSTPTDPRPITRFTTGMETGVHNVWIEGDWLYVVLDGPMGLRIVDVSNPAAPRIASQWYAGESFLHDVYVRDGLAFLSHWNAGLVILDVGNGIVGGTPEAPGFVSQLRELGGQTHNAWYWPERKVVFVGEEDFGSGGVMHVVDLADPRAPREVATFDVPGGVTPHNFWLDEAEETLFLAWYEKGLRALDVSGELVGELDRQGRELGALEIPGGRVWAPQLEGGALWLSTMDLGLHRAEWVRER